MASRYTVFRTGTSPIAGWVGSWARTGDSLLHPEILASTGSRRSRLDPDVVVTLPHLFPNVEETIRLKAVAPWKLIYVPMLHEDDPYWSIERVLEAVRGGRCGRSHRARTRAAPRVVRQRVRRPPRSSHRE